MRQYVIIIKLKKTYHTIELLQRLLEQKQNLVSTSNLWLYLSLLLYPSVKEFMRLFWIYCRLSVLNLEQTTATRTHTNTRASSISCCCIYFMFRVQWRRPEENIVMWTSSPTILIDHIAAYTVMITTKTTTIQHQHQLH